MTDFVFFSLALFCLLSFLIGAVLFTVGTAQALLCLPDAYKNKDDEQNLDRAERMALVGVFLIAAAFASAIAFGEGAAP